MRDMAFYASIRGVLEKRWFMAELGFNLQHYQKRSFEERMWRSKFVLGVYKDFG